MIQLTNHESTVEDDVMVEQTVADKLAARRATLPSIKPKSSWFDDENYVNIPGTNHFINKPRPIPEPFKEEPKGLLVFSPDVALAKQQYKQLVSAREENHRLDIQTTQQQVQLGEKQSSIAWKNSQLRLLIRNLKANPGDYSIARIIDSLQAVVNNEMSEDEAAEILGPGWW